MHFREGHEFVDVFVERRRRSIELFRLQWACRRLGPSGRCRETGSPMSRRPRLILFAGPGWSRRSP